MKHTILLSVLLAASLPVTLLAKESTAPLGLTWGLSQEQVKKQGVILRKCKNGKGLIICRTMNPPKPVSFGDFYYLVFYPQKGLIGAGIIGQDISDDSTGAEGKALYAKVKASLGKKYGQPASEYEYVGRKLYDEDDEFYQCLRYAGCGSWFSVWEADSSGSVDIKIEGTLRGEGRLMINYKSKELTQILNDIEAAEAASDADAL